MTSPRLSNFYLTWISSIWRSGEKLARLQWTADDRLVLTHIVDAGTREEKPLFDVPITSLKLAKTLAHWLTVVLADGSKYQVSLASALPFGFFDQSTVGDQMDIMAAHPAPTAEDWTIALREHGVEVQRRSMFTLVGLATLGLLVVVAVITLLVM